MKKGLIILFIFLSNNIFSQKNNIYTFGNITSKEHALKIYAKDTTANAVFLFENGETVFKDTPNKIIISTKYYAKVKIFNKEGFDNATIEIPIYHNKESSEKVNKIKAVTHNLYKKTSLNKENVFTEKINEHWSVIKFTMPNLKEQSIIEYEYTLESPFKFNFKGWTFQSDIPNLYSRFYALIPGNYIYNRSLIGSKQLNFNEAKVKKHCFSLPGFAKAADCEELTYIMENIPAFIEEDHMTSRKNYESRIKFELSQFNGFDGSRNKFTKRWKDVDKEFRTDKDIGRQLRKVDYIKKQLPLDLLEGEINLQKATKIYNYIKRHFSWDNKTRIFSEVNVKKAFESKIGNATEINIALTNALNAAGFDTNIMLISTRKNGLPTKAHPVMTDFNYAIAKLDIGTESYLLDATNKLMPFGMLPFRCLNGYGRVMDFKNDSYWFDIIPKRNNQIRMAMNLKINNDGNFEGLMHKSYNGYIAIEKRDEINTLTEEKYLNDIEDVDDKLIINSYKKYNLDSIDVPLKELFDIEIDSDNDLNQEVVILNPFINSKIPKNPFQLEERTYPVNFGYPRTFQYTLLLKIPEQYKVSSLPANVAFKLPNNGGNYIFNIDKKGNKINLISRYNITRSYFVPEEYPYLKEFYNQIIKTQKSLITLEKIN